MKAEAIYPAFSGGSWHADIYVAALDRTTEDFGHLVGQEILIEGDLYRCTGVGRFAHTPPYHRGEMVELRVKPTQRSGDGDEA